MKNRNRKGARTLWIENSIMDGATASVGDIRLWSKAALGFDKETRICQARLMASEVFLQTRLFPLVGGQEPLNEEKIIDMLVDFKRSRADLDVEFEMAQVVARILSRFQCHLVDGMDGSLNILSDSLAREVELFSVLANLDMQNIDKTVWNRLHSG